MGIGLSVFLVAIGAILRFAVHASVNRISIHSVGVILMIAGAVGLVVTLTIFAPRRRITGVADRTVTDPAVIGSQVVITERLTPGQLPPSTDRAQLNAVRPPAATQRRH
jgi:hypothetical protein